MPDSYRTLKLKQKQQTAWITLDRPDKLNAINATMLQELSDAVDRLEEDPNVRCTVITGAGEKAFSAGADLTELSKLAPENAAEFSAKGQQVFGKLEKLSKPVIAAINGYALGGGLELALACDFRLASENAEFGCPEIKLGFLPAWGGTQRLPLVVGMSHAKRLIMNGDRISAEEAHKIGLVDRVVPAKSLEAEAEKLAQWLAECSQTELKNVKQTTGLGREASFVSGLNKETEAFVQLFSEKATRDKLEAFVSQRNKKEGDC